MTRPAARAMATPGERRGAVAPCRVAMRRPTARFRALLRGPVLLLLALGQAGVLPAQAADPATLLEAADAHFAAGNRLAGQTNAAGGTAGSVRTEASAAAAEQFRAALLRYRRAAQALGHDNGYLLYNIGNTYLRLGDLGRAILHYRTAQQLIPGDPNLAPKPTLRPLAARRPHRGHRRPDRGPATPVLALHRAAAHSPAAVPDRP